MAEAEAATEATQPITVQNGHIYGVDGMPLTIKGVNWFGFETAVTVVHGLWQGPTALTQEFQNVALRIRLLGFNTIRLPFSFQVIVTSKAIMRFFLGANTQKRRHLCPSVPKAWALLFSKMCCIPLCYEPSLVYVLHQYAISHTELISLH